MATSSLTSSCVSKKTRQRLQQLLSSRCRGDCYVSKETGCAVLGKEGFENIVRNFDCLTTHSTNRESSDQGKEPRETEEDEDDKVDPNLNEFRCPPEETCWIDSLSDKKLEKILSRCWRRHQERGNKAYRFEKYFSQVDYIKPGTVASGHIVRFTSPWDFHVIFEGIVDYSKMEKSGWKFFFQKDEYQNFKTSAQVFRTLTISLSQFMKFVLEKATETKKPVKHNVGDMVVVAIRRPEPAQWGHCFFGYRGVVLEYVTVITEELNKIDCYKVYLLDTGEEQLVSPKFLLPLTRAFLDFPPLAVKCSLHGVSPIHPDDVNSSCKRVTDLIFSKNQRIHYTAEFYSWKKDNKVPDLSPLQSYIYQEPYEIELFTSSPKDAHVPSSNISASLINKYLVLERILFPQRPTLQQKTKLLEAEKGNCDKKEDHANPDPEPYTYLFRPESLFYCKPSPQQVVGPTEDCVERDIRHLFVNEDTFLRPLDGVTNILAVKVDDPYRFTRRSCVPVKPI